MSQVLRSAIAHDLRTPLTVLKGYQEMMMEFIPEEKLDREALLDMLKESMGQVERLERFLDRIGYTGALKAPVRCFGNHLSEKRKSLFQTDNKCGGAAILKNRTSRMGTPVGC